MTSNREVLLFLEGVIIGVYGNWLISYIDKIQEQLSSILLIIWVQLTLVCFSLVAFLAFTLFMFLENQRTRNLLISIVLHLGFLYYARSLGVQEFSLPMYMQFVMGGVLLVMLLFIDARRIQIPPRGYGQVLG